MIKIWVVNFTIFRVFFLGGGILLFLENIKKMAKKKITLVKYNLYQISNLHIGNK